jgi:hypothetical protein
MNIGGWLSKRDDCWRGVFSELKGLYLELILPIVFSRDYFFSLPLPYLPYFKSSSSQVALLRSVG